MAGIGAIVVVAGGTNGDGAAVSGEGNALSRLIPGSFSIDVGTELLPTGRPGAAVNCQVAGGWFIDIVDVKSH